MEKKGSEEATRASLWLVQRLCTDKQFYPLFFMFVDHLCLLKTYKSCKAFFHAASAKSLAAVMLLKGAAVYYVVQTPVAGEQLFMH